MLTVVTRKRAIISIFGFFYFTFYTDIFTYTITALVEQQYSKQPAHPPVTVVKRMNTKKITNKKRYQNKRVKAMQKL